MPIYFMQGEAGGPIKIGWATDVEDRVRRLQPGNPDKLRIVLRLNRDQREEDSFHKLFADDHLRGEWYWPSKNMIEQIRRMGGDAVGGEAGGPGEIRRLLKNGDAVSIRTISQQIPSQYGSSEYIPCYVDIRWYICTNIQALTQQERSTVIEHVKLAARGCLSGAIAGFVGPRSVDVIVQIPVDRSVGSIASSIKRMSCASLQTQQVKFRNASAYGKIWSEDTQYLPVSDTDDLSPMLKHDSWF